MANWLVKRQLRQTSMRITRLRDELAILNEQMDSFESDAESSAIRALVSDRPGVGSEASADQRHADAMRNHRRHVIDSIAALERRQDELLDQLTR